MIGYISGKLHRVNDNSAIVNVSGVGYEVYCPKNSLATLGTPNTDVSFEIYTHVSENNLQLFGFRSVKEKAVFQKVISVSGIGPKLGLAVLSDLSLNDLLTAIINGDTTTLTRINGVGKKTAERIVVELKDKFKVEFQISQSQEAANDTPKQDSKIDDVINALISLGYPAFHAKKSVEGLSVKDEDTVQDLIKRSLGGISK